MIAYVVIQRVVQSRFGRAMVALKENESLAVSVGIDVTRYLVLAAVISAAIAGAAGSLYAHYLRIIDPDIFLFLYTVTMVIMVITGGKGTLAGPVVGGAIFGCDPRGSAVLRFARGAVDPLRRAHGRDHLCAAARDRARDTALVCAWTTEGRSASAAQSSACSQVTSDRAPALTIEHVAVHFGGLVAIADMNFVVNEGELLSLIGPNGAGKTTAFNVITGFLRPTKGDVRYRGTSLTRLKPHEVAALGLVRTFQRTSVFRAHTVFDNVLTGLHLRGRSNASGDPAAPSRRAFVRARFAGSRLGDPRACRCRASGSRTRRSASPMATSGFLASHWHSPRNHRCCFSTNRFPA